MKRSIKNILPAQGISNVERGFCIIMNIEILKELTAYDTGFKLLCTQLSILVIDAFTFCIDFMYNLVIEHGKRSVSIDYIFYGFYYS